MAKDFLITPDGLEYILRYVARMTAQYAKSGDVNAYYAQKTATSLVFRLAEAMDSAANMLSLLTGKKVDPLPVYVIDEENASHLIQEITDGGDMGDDVPEAFRRLIDDLNMNNTEDPQ